MVPRWSKKSLLGMKYPASRMIGGSMKRKKVSGVRVVGTSSEVRMSRNPIRMPTTISRQDSGKMWGNLGVMWKPGAKKNKLGTEVGAHMWLKQLCRSNKKEKEITLVILLGQIPRSMPNKLQ